MKQLIVYPNCSMGGVSAVIRGRAATNPTVHFDLLFEQDRGGRNAYADLPNVSIHILPKGRREEFFRYMRGLPPYDWICVLSDPESANALSEDGRNSVYYEFHSSNLSVVRKELKALESDRMAGFVVPSEIMRTKVDPLLPPRIRPRLEVIPNLVTPTLFDVDGPAAFFLEPDSTVPLIWIGRFDRGKGAAQFVRLLAQLPDRYVGIMLTSIESAPERMSSVIAESYALGVNRRICYYANLPQGRVAELFRSVREKGGWNVSTSFAESFGYSAYEASLCGLRTVAFDLPAWQEVEAPEQITVVPIGDVVAMASEILAKA